MILDDSGAGHFCSPLPRIGSWHLGLCLCADLLASVGPRAVLCTPTAGITLPQSPCLFQAEGLVGAVFHASG